MKEPDIKINGVQLSDPQAQAVRVAVAHLQGDLQQEGHGLIAELCSDRLEEVAAIIRRDAQEPITALDVTVGEDWNEEPTCPGTPTALGR